MIDNDSFNESFFIVTESGLRVRLTAMKYLSLLIVTKLKFALIPNKFIGGGNGPGRSE